MRIEVKKQWYAVYTRAKSEKKVVDLLTRRKVEVYCPVNKARKQWSERKKSQTEPLFTSYVFVCVSERELQNVKQIDGVVNFVHWLNKPAVIRQEEIDTIRKFVSEYDHITVEKATVNLQDHVRIINGPLMMWEGNVVEIRTNTVKLILPSLGQTLVAEIKKENLQKVTALHELQTKAI